MLYKKTTATESLVWSMMVNSEKHSGQNLLPSVVSFAADFWAATSITSWWGLQATFFSTWPFPEPGRRSRSDTDMRSSVITSASSRVWESGAADAPVHASAELISSSCMQANSAFVWLLLLLMKNWCSFIIVCVLGFSSCACAHVWVTPASISHHGSLSHYDKQKGTRESVFFIMKNRYLMSIVMYEMIFNVYMYFSGH